MANKTVTEQREQVIAMLSELKSYNKTAFKKLDSIEERLKSQNGRIGDLEMATSLIKGVGLTIASVLAAFIALLKGEFK